MKFLDVTWPTAEENLAYDEALLDFCEDDGTMEILRFWEPTTYFVVVGFGNSVLTEVNSDLCRQEKVPIFRRCSGGGTVVQGSGCLNYSLILNVNSVALSTVTGANRLIMERQRSALEELLKQPVSIQGHTDLTLDRIKFSGNAQRRKKTHLLFHGSFLLQFDIPLIEKLLTMPSRQPDYRGNRSHEKFLTNIKVNVPALKEALKQTWCAQDVFDTSPVLPLELVLKYSSESWNLRI